MSQRAREGGGGEGRRRIGGADAAGVRRCEGLNTEQPTSISGRVQHSAAMDIEDLAAETSAAPTAAGAAGVAAAARAKRPRFRLVVEDEGDDFFGGRSTKMPNSTHKPQSDSTTSAGSLFAAATVSPPGAAAGGRRSALEAVFGVEVWQGGGERVGYLYNITQSNFTVAASKEKKQVYSGLNMYFVTEEGMVFRSTLLHRPHFAVGLRRRAGDAAEAAEAAAAALGERLSKFNVSISEIGLIDLRDSSHLAAYGPSAADAAAAAACSDFRSPKRKLDFLRLSFPTVKELVEAKQDLSYLIRESAHRRSSPSSSSLNFGVLDADSTPDLNLDLSSSSSATTGACKQQQHKHSLDVLEEIFEADVPYISRCCIDLDIRCGRWYSISRQTTSISEPLKLSVHPTLSSAAPLSVLAFDIECFKEPLKFPDAQKDPVILLSYVFNQQGYLIVNREFIAAEIPCFAFSPHADLRGLSDMIVFNEDNETKAIQRFASHLSRLKPHVVVTYNGDDFDLPYLFTRANLLGVDLSSLIGLLPPQKGEAVVGVGPVLHLDAFKWVERDSYLPQGSRTLKSVCKMKLGFNPVEVDPEDMVPMAYEDPQRLSVYSVSDAMTTYLLYCKFIHSFILALSSIIPMPPESVLRQGTGTLCEFLLMAEANGRHIVFPNKHQQQLKVFWKDKKTQKTHLVLQDSYTGGRVESLRCGIYRRDLLERFELQSASVCALEANVESVLEFWMQEESKTLGRPLSPSSFVDFDQHLQDIQKRLLQLKQKRLLLAKPLLLHLDVSAMYPNIILTQRLQPPAIKTNAQCNECPWKDKADECQRKLHWRRKLEVTPAEKGEVLSIERHLASAAHAVHTTPSSSNAKGKGTRFTKSENDNERADSGGSQGEEGGTDEEEYDDDDDEGNSRANKREKQMLSKKSWHELTDKQKHFLLIKAVKKYCQKAHKKTKIVKEVEEESIVCQRENSFYVDTVRAFRDRRYVFKKKLKEVERHLHKLKQTNAPFQAIKQAADLVLLNDSLQLAHKCILNSFYGYVKRPGARWFSMEMGAIVTKMGADVIQTAKDLVDGIGITLELDTDGIWCLLPDIFPLSYTFTLKPTEEATQAQASNDNSKSNGFKTLRFEYPTWVLNKAVFDRFKNPQFLSFDIHLKEFKNETKNEIFFELDGPWEGMFLPASEKSDALLKKRYVVYGSGGTISELKGFELKRRGELEVIRRLQSEIFPMFMHGSSKEAAFAAAAAVGERYLLLLQQRGAALRSREQLQQLLVSRKVLAKSVAAQSLSKSLSITTAERLAELLQNKSYLTDAPVSVHFLVSALPPKTPLAARALPVQLLQAQQQQQQQYLQTWLGLTPAAAAAAAKHLSLLIDWEYYLEKIETQLLKLLVIPAIRQNLKNPLPKLQLPSWLLSHQSIHLKQQHKIDHFFKPVDCGETYTHKQQQQKLPAGGQSRDVDRGATEASAAATTVEAQQQQQPKQQEQKMQHQQQKLQQRQQRQQEIALFKNDIQGWIAAQRIKWQKLREELRVLQRRRAGGNLSYSMGLSSDATVKELLSSFSRVANMSKAELGVLLGERWEVLDFHRQCKEDEGLFCLRLTTPSSRRFFSVPVQIFRHLYVNSTTQLSNTTISSNGNGSGSGSSSTINGIRVKPLTGRYLLPRGLKQLHLAELSLLEKVYRTNKSSIYASFHQRAAGIFEGNLPLDFAFLSRMGNMMEAHTTDIRSLIGPPGNFLSVGFSRVSPPGVATTPLGSSTLSVYGSSFKPLFVHVIHSNSRDKQGGPSSLRTPDRLFCAVYEPHTHDPGSPNPLDPTQTCTNTSAAFFIGGSMHKEINPSLLQQQLLQRALEQQKKDQQDEEEEEEEEEMEGCRSTRTADPISGVCAADSADDIFASVDTEKISNFKAAHSLHRPLCRFFCSSSSTSGSTAAAAAAAARAQQKDISQTLRALEEYLYAKQQQQHASPAAAAGEISSHSSRSHSNSTSKYIILLLSTLPYKELGHWARSASLTNPYNSSFTIPIISLEPQTKLRTLSKTHFAEVAFRESQGLLLQQQELFEASLWLSRTMSFPLGMAIKGLGSADPTTAGAADAAQPSGPETEAGVPPPLGGFRGPRETMKILYDSFFAQTLRQHKGILWSSNCGTSNSSSSHVDFVLRQKETDIGGACVSASAYGDFDLKERQNPKTNPGIYRYICYELALGDSLIFNSVRLADKVDPEYLSASDWLRSEGDALAAAAAAAAASGNDRAADDDEVEAAEATPTVAQGQPAADLALEGFHSPTQFSPAAFRVLGFALQRLFGCLYTLQQKRAAEGNRLSSFIFSAFYPWICDPRTILFDVALKHKVQRHAEVYLLLLLKELSSSFSFKVIAADLRRIMVSSQLVAAPAAQQQLQHALQQLQEQPLFEALAMYPSDSFVAVLQLDERDWIGYREFVPFANSSSSSSSTNSSLVAEGVCDHLHVLRCFPPPLLHFIQTAIDRAVQLPLLQLLHRMNEHEDDFCQSSSNSGSSSNQWTRDEVAAKLSELAVAFWFAAVDEDEEQLTSNESIRERQNRNKRKNKSLLQTFKRYLNDPMQLLRKYGSASEIRQSKELSFKSLQLPACFGSRIWSSSWRHLAVSFVCRLMEVDQNIDYQQQSWAEALAERSHSLYTLAGESDGLSFSWVSPLSSLYIADVFCPSCNLVKDLEVVSALEDVLAETVDGQQVVLKVCKCPSCGAALDDDLLEGHLLRALQEMHYAFLAQDFYCVGCNSVCVTRLREKCKCGKPFRSRLDPKIWEEFLQTTQEVAVEMGFATLQSCLVQIQEAWC